MRKTGLILTLLAVMATPTLSQAGSNIAGAGYTMCGDFTANVEDKSTRDLMISWFLGFFSGMNAVNDAAGRPQRDLSELGTDEKAGAVLDMIAGKCADAPDAPLVMQVHPIYETLPEYQK